MPIGPLAELARHAFMHVAFEVIPELPPFHHGWNYPIASPPLSASYYTTYPRIAFIVDENGVAIMTKEYQKYAEHIAYEKRERDGWWELKFRGTL